MKVLVTGVDLETFVREQCLALEAENVEIIKYQLRKKGVWGYLKEALHIWRMAEKYHPDIIHAHYGLSGLCANFQRKIPVVTTYHGSDIHRGGWILKLSRLSMRLSSYNIFVSQKLFEQSGYRKGNSSVIPCGIDLKNIREVSKETAKKELNNPDPFILFSGSFANKVKNPSLAKEAIRKVAGIRLVELKGYSHYEVNLLMNAADCLLMTSDKEGSPQVIKEAMACGTPIVTVDVGDAKDIIGNTEGCFIAKRYPDDIAEKIKEAMTFKGKTNGRERIMALGLGNETIARKIIKIYEQMIKTTLKDD